MNDQKIDSTWLETLRARLPLFGHRNWIVVADSAYPAQTSPGIETLLASEELPDVVAAVLEEIDRSTHVRPILYVDAELEFVSESDASGVDDLRGRLSHSLAGWVVTHLLHEQIIQMLDQAGQVFRVLIIKTPLAIPYTSVFIQLDCGYWSAAAEHRLRSAISAT